MFEILTFIFNSGYENLDLVDGQPARFATVLEAQKELEEFLLDASESAACGDLQDEYNPQDYLIKNSKTFETYHIVWNEDKSGIKLINPEDFIKAS